MWATWECLKKCRCGGCTESRCRERNWRKLRLKETESFNITQLRLAGRRAATSYHEIKCVRPSRCSMFYWTLWQTNTLAVVRLRGLAEECTESLDFAVNIDTAWAPQLPFFSVVEFRWAWEESCWSSWGESPVCVGGWVGVCKAQRHSIKREQGIAT